MNKILFSMLLLATSFSSHSNENFDPTQCHRIQSVDVPFEVSLKNHRIEFTDQDNHIAVSNSGYWINQQLITIDNYSSYYQSLQQFFKLSSDFAQFIVAETGVKPEFKNMTNQDWRDKFTSNTAPEFFEKSIAMCQSIVDLGSVHQTVLSYDPNFISGVAITLGEG
ncbi:MAG: hypothetical protein JKY14_04295 [Paraglaciecola sp.]|nr:hypothetical protein [Paraglaciecola sp.]